MSPEIYEFDMQRTLQLWFGTTDDRHPGVKRVISQGNKAVAGKVTLVNRLPEAYAQYALTPSQTRFIFSHKGWSRVVGFHWPQPRPSRSRVHPA